MFESLVDLVSSSGWTYVIVFAVAAIDGFFPLVPSETMAITAGVFAGAGELSLALVIVCAAAGAILGDNIAYLLGRRLGEPWVRHRLRTEKALARLDFAERHLGDRGPYLIVVARFIPGGRVAVNFAAGVVRTLTWRRFFAFDVLAGVLWGTYCGLVGYIGGSAFEEEPWKGLLVAFAIAVGVTVAVETVRHVRRRRAGEAL